MGICEESVIGEEMQEVDKFNYLGVMISIDCGMGEEVAHRVLAGREIWEMMAKLGKENMLSREVIRELYGRVMIPTVAWKRGR